MIKVVEYGRRSGHQGVVPVFQATGQPAESYPVDSRTGLDAATSWGMLDSAKRIIIKLCDAAVTLPSMTKEHYPPTLPCCSRGRAAMLALAVMLGACSSPLPPAPATAPDKASIAPAPAAQPSASAAIQQNDAASPLPLDDAASQITIIVRRGGLLARLGHDHLILVKNLRGSVDQRHQCASLQFRLDEMEVDPAALRLAAGLQPQPSAEAISGTRRNMLTRTLDAERYPLVQIQAERQGEELALQITLHGVTRSLRVPAVITSDGHGVRAEGSFTILQSDYGITPFAVMGGALAVQDPLELHYRLLAH